MREDGPEADVDFISGDRGLEPQLGGYVTSVLSLRGTAILGAVSRPGVFPRGWLLAPEGLSTVPLSPRPVSGTLSLGQNFIVITL